MFAIASHAPANTGTTQLRSSTPWMTLTVSGPAGVSRKRRERHLVAISSASGSLPIP